VCCLGMSLEVGEGLVPGGGLQGQTEGVSAEARGDIRTAGSNSRAGSGLAQAGIVSGSRWG
jgi:hypothetical protein